MPKFFIKKAAPKLSPRPDRPERSEGTGLADPIKTYLTWVAPTRPYRQKDRSYYTTIAIIVTLLILISLLAREYLMVGVLLALAFVTYVLGFVPPEDVEYKISAQGVTVGDRFYFWEDLQSFWFSEKEGHKILHVLTHLRFPAQLMIMLRPSSEEEVKRVVARYLPFHEIPPTSIVEKWAESLQKHFPLENPRR